MYTPFFPSRRIAKNWGILDQAFTDWLYGPYDQEKLDLFEKLYAIGPLRSYIDYKLDVRADEEYMSRYNMGYQDIHDPRKLHQTSSGASMYGAAYRMVSKNIDKLYKD